MKLCTSKHKIKSVYWLLPSWRFWSRLKEYRFGSDIVAYFLIINSRGSLAPIVTLVELEPVGDNVFTQKKPRNAIDPLSFQQWFRRGEVELNSFIFIGRRKKVLDKDLRTKLRITVDERLRCYAPSPKFAYRRTSFIRETLSGIAGKILTMQNFINDLG